jgi:hypothetical protein
MKIIISESQNKMLLTESFVRRISDSIKQLTTFSKKVLNDASEQTGLDFGFMLSWGATLGGLMMPVSKFIEGEYPELSSIDVSLLITGAIVTYYTSNKKILGELLEIIKEKGLVKIFDDVLRTTNKLRTVFLSFIESLNVTMGNLANMLAYTFIIPVLPQLYQMAQEGFSSEDTSIIVKRLMSYGIVTISGIILKSLINKILKRFKN